MFIEGLVYTMTVLPYLERELGHELAGFGLQKSLMLASSRSLTTTS